MLAKIGTEIPSGRGWTFEPKYDGVRVLAFADGDAVALMSRNGKDKRVQFPEVVEALAELSHNARRPFVLDGEIIALSKGKPARFQALQSRMHVVDAAAIEQHLYTRQTNHQGG